MIKLTNVKKTGCLLSFFLLILFLPLFSGCNNNCLEGGEEISQIRKTGSFNKVKTSGAIRLMVKQSPQTSVRIEAGKNLMPFIKTQVSEKTLIVGFDNSFCHSEDDITVYLSSPEYEEIKTSGAVVTESEGTLKVPQLFIHVSGACVTNLTLDVLNLSTSASGACVTTLDGKAAVHDVKIRGAVVLNAGNLPVKQYNIESEGASKAVIHVTDELNVKAGGAGVIEYKGSPKMVNNDGSVTTVLRDIY